MALLKRDKQTFQIIVNKILTDKNPQNSLSQIISFFVRSVLFNLLFMQEKKKVRVSRSFAKLKTFFEVFLTETTNVDN